MRYLIKILRKNIEYDEYYLLGMLERMVENYNPENPETNATPEEEEIIRYLYKNE